MYILNILKTRILFQIMDKTILLTYNTLHPKVHIRKCMTIDQPAPDKQLFRL